MSGSGLNWFWTRTEPSRTGSGRFGSGSGSVHPGGSRFWFWFSKNGLRTELNWTLATLSWATFASSISVSNTFVSPSALLPGSCSSSFNISCSMWVGSSFPPPESTMISSNPGSQIDFRELLNCLIRLETLTTFLRLFGERKMIWEPVNYVHDWAMSCSTITYLCDQVDSVWKAACARSTAAKVRNHVANFWAPLQPIVSIY